MQADSNLYVIDSSVAIKWLTKEEPFLTEALSVFEDYFEDKISLIVPDVFWWELGNYYGREMDVKSGYIAIQNMKKNRMKTYMLTNSIIMQTLELMQDFTSISFYDASYHALALETGGVFLSSDKKYYEKTKKLGSIQFLPHYRQKSKRH